MELRVREILKEKGMTAKELAAKINMTETGLCIALSDKGNPTLSKLCDMAEALGVPIRELFWPSGAEVVSRSTLLCPGCGKKILITALVIDEAGDSEP